MKRHINPYLIILGLLLSFQLIGLIYIESGAEFTTILVSGYEKGYNIGASYYYSIYFLLIFLFYFLFRKKRYSSFKYDNRIYKKSRKKVAKGYFGLNKVIPKRFIFITTCTLFIILCYFLFLEGAIQVLSGNIGRGAFRRTTVLPGILEEPLTNYLPKLLITAATFFYIKFKFKSNLFVKASIYISYLFVIGIAVSSGFKASLVWYLAPPMLIIFYYKEFDVLKVLVVFGVTGSLAILGATYVTLGTLDKDILLYLLKRLLVIPSEVPWLIVEEYTGESTFFEYFKTLYFVLGAQLLTLVLGIEYTLYNLIEYNWGYFITSLIGYNASTIVGGHNNTATSFGEAWFMGEFVGVFIFALIIASIIYLLIKVQYRSLRQQNILMISLPAVYFWGQFMPWINSGGITRLLNVNLVIAYSIAILLFLFLWNLSRIRIISPRDNE